MNRPSTWKQGIDLFLHLVAFDLDAALQEARDITGRDDAGAHIGSDS